MSSWFLRLRRWISAASTAASTVFQRPPWRSRRAVSQSGPRQREDRDSKSLGKWGENLAADYLETLGYKIVARGYWQRVGEIDLIALDGSQLVFVEVKTWMDRGGEDPASAVDLRKQRRITRAALIYLKTHRLLDQPSRFDVISIVWRQGVAQTPDIRHYKNAFEASGIGPMF